MGPQVQSIGTHLLNFYKNDNYHVRKTLTDQPRSYLANVNILFLMSHPLPTNHHR